MGVPFTISHFPVDEVPLHDVLHFRVLESHHHLDRSYHITNAHVLSHFYSVDSLCHLHFYVEQDLIAIKHLLFSLPVSLVDAELFNSFARWRSWWVYTQGVYFFYLPGSLHPLKMFIDSTWINFGIGRDRVSFEQLLVLVFFLRDYIIGVSNKMGTSKCIRFSDSRGLHISRTSYNRSWCIRKIRLECTLLKFFLDFF